MRTITTCKSTEKVATKYQKALPYHPSKAKSQLFSRKLETRSIMLVENFKESISCIQDLNVLEVVEEGDHLVEVEVVRIRVGEVERYLPRRIVGVGQIGQRQSIQEQDPEERP